MRVSYQTETREGEVSVQASIPFIPPGVALALEGGGFRPDGLKELLTATSSLPLTS